MIVRRNLLSAESVQEFLQDAITRPIRLGMIYKSFWIALDKFIERIAFQLTQCGFWQFMIDKPDMGNFFR